MDARHLRDSDRSSVGDGVSELRIEYGPGYRVYFGKRQHQIVVLLCGGDKRGQSDDIQQAKVYWKEHKNA